MSELNKKIDKLLDVFAESVLVAKSKEEAAAVPLWPLPTPKGVLYWGKEWSERLNQVLHLVDKQGISDKEIAEAIKFPSRIVHILWRTDAIKNSSLNKKERLYIIEKLFEILSIFRKKDLFCEEGGDVIWSKKELEVYKEGLHFFSGKNKRLNRLISELEAALYLYTELLYWANHPLGHSFHGPYPDGEGDLLVREYFDLKPEVWPFSQDLRFLEIEIFEIYRKGTASKIELEFLERGVRTTEPLKHDLEKFAVKIDGKPAKMSEEISQPLKNLLKVIEGGSRIIQSLDEQQVIEKHAQYWFWVLKPLGDLVGEDWRPPKQVRDNIYKKYEEIDTIWQNIVKRNFEKMAALSYKQQEKILKEYFDPRE